MEQIFLADNVKLTVKENILAVSCDSALETISSAFHNGGTKQVKAVLNVGVPEGYSDLSLHLDPIELITSSASKVGFYKDYLAMVTAAKIKNYSLVTKKTTDFSVSAIATAGCSHGETSGEEMDVQEIVGTINIIVFIDGNPSESCMVAALITTTEAKSAVLRDFDVRSRYTGDSATGSITDSVTIASNCAGRTLSLGGPASKLGKLVGYCARKAVAEALLKQEPVWACRSVLDRLKERHLSVEKLAAEISKVEGLTLNTEGLVEILKKNPFNLIYLLAAAKMDDDFKKNLLPTDFPDWMQTSKFFGLCTQNKLENTKTPNYEFVDLPPFIKHTLINIIRKEQSTV